MSTTKPLLVKEVGTHDLTSVLCQPLKIDPSLVMLMEVSNLKSLVVNAVGENNDSYPERLADYLGSGLDEGFGN
jgi:hypothetical protein